MTKRSRRSHGTAFKAKVAFEAIKEQRTISELSERFQVHRNLITKWKKQLLDRAEEIFAAEKASDNDPAVQELHFKIRQLSMENDFLSVALGRIRGYKRKTLIMRDHGLPIVRQCQILQIARSGVYRKPVLISIVDGSNDLTASNYFASKLSTQLTCDAHDITC